MFLEETLSQLETFLVEGRSGEEVDEFLQETWAHINRLMADLIPAAAAPEVKKLSYDEKLRRFRKKEKGRKKQEYLQRKAIALNPRKKFNDL